ncbi:MAG: extracellular solute-binding protein [Armatimonadota bacterium]|nr:extracellular solute-binding protein [bacterium]
MNTKQFCAWVCCGLIAITLVAWRIQPKPVEDGKVQLIWSTDDNPARREQTSLFNKLYPRYSLKIDPSNSGMEKVIVQSIAGVGPDIYDSYNSQINSYVKAGIAWDITDELIKMGVDINKDMWSCVRPFVTYNGRVYGFATNAGSCAFWINKDIFDQQHVPYPKGPWKWNEFLTVAKRMTIRDKNGRVKVYGLIGAWDNWQTFVLQHGGKMYNSDGTRCTLDSPESIAGIQFIHDLVYKYHVSPTPVDENAMATQGGWGSGTISLFGGGKAAMGMGGRWWLCTLRNYKGLRLGAVECPYGPLHIFWGYGKATLLNKTSPRRYEALQFIKYVTSKDYNELNNHQADALAPMIRYSYTDKYLHDPAYPKEDFNAVWRDAMKFAVAMPSSPFIEGGVEERIFYKQLDLVKTNQKSAAKAMQTAARLINAEIRNNVSKDPVLGARYTALMKRHRQ